MIEYGRCVTHHQCDCLSERLMKAEKERDELRAENEKLKAVRHDDYQDYQTLRAKLQRIAEIADEALGFYADRSNWVSRTGRIGTSAIDVYDRDSSENGDFPWSGGKKARKAREEIKEVLG